jgi:putative transposase
MVRPSAKRDAVKYLKVGYAVSERRACKAINIPRSTQRYRKIADDSSSIRGQIKDLAGEHRRYGYRRIHVLLRRSGLAVNHKRTYRIYREENLSVRKKIRRKLPTHLRVATALPTSPNERWSMDFVSDRLMSGKRIKMLTVIDDYSKECPLIYVDTSITGSKITELLDNINRVLPKTIISDNGPEFISRSLDAWAYLKGIKLDHIRPGKPVDNCFIESFNGKLRDELLEENIFNNLEHARLLVENWRQQYNNFRPHSSLKNKTPMDFLRDLGYEKGETAKLNVA